ncbi:MAG TPA: hypothetical protein VF062_22280 [Candidatus Limnocylindrales bacterium]
MTGRDEARRSGGTVPEPSRVLTCRCDVVARNTPGAYCGVHDRAATYSGPVLRGESP